MVFTWPVDQVAWAPALAAQPANTERHAILASNMVRLSGYGGGWVEGEQSCQDATYGYITWTFSSETVIAIIARVGQGMQYNSKTIVRTSSQTDKDECRQSKDLLIRDTYARTRASALSRRCCRGPEDIRQGAKQGKRSANLHHVATLRIPD